MRKKVIILIFFIITALGALFQIVGQEHELHGVSDETSLSVSKRGLWDGSSQSGAETWINQELTAADMDDTYSKSNHVFRISYLYK